MRRPAQHRPNPTGHPGWAHPYPASTFSPVFYADGDPNPVPAPPKPAPPAPGPTFTQEDLDRIAAKEKAQGQRAGARQALEEFAAEHGFTNVDDAKTFIATARKAQEDALSEQEKREKELSDREARAEARERAAEARERAAARREVLSGLGATGVDLEDAAALLRVADDADSSQISEAAEKLKERRPELFGVAKQADPAAAPPAPSGMPAPGMPRPGGSQPKPGQRGLDMLKRRGKIAADA
jgi:hypothetical protein